MKPALAIALLIAWIGAPALPAAEPARLPEPVARQVDFHKEIVPILANSCAKCHAGAKHEGGFSIETRESLLAGGDSGLAIVPGKSGESLLLSLVAGAEPERIMPAQGPRLTADQMALLRGWIDQGAAWEAGFSFRRTPAAPIEPRAVVVPPAVAADQANPVDRILAPYFAAHDLKPGEIVPDPAFLRRASWDLIGLPPEPLAAQKFVEGTAADKRGQLVSQLLNDRQQYATHWLSFWNDALRNDYRGTGYIDGGRLQITDWLAKSLVDNLPYDEFVRQLINPGPESAGFIKGIVWRGVVNASQVPPVQAAQNISQVFLGINLKCASCHDSFINDWKLADAYGLASIFADEPLEMHRCDKPTGRFATMQFLYPQLGSIDPQALKPERLKQLAAALTRPENGRFARTIVNRLWARLLGRGLVEPVDEMDNPPWNADLLDYLANDLVEHHYDLKHTIERIVTSRAYQLSAVSEPVNSREEFVFRGPLVRRLTAEQFADAIASLAGVEYAPPAAKPPALADSAAQSPGEQVARRATARSALVNADPLLIALGRSNREQVVTERPTTATTLQALELTNGAPLAALLEKGAKRWREQSSSPGELIDRIYGRALLRAPSSAEQQLAVELLTPNVTPQGIEDLLWALAMLPEFQLIY